nr:hypothetical protein [Tanacetum cinerariifolium]
DNRPPMLEKDMYDSWKSRMEMYMLNRQQGRMILESVESGPLLWPTIEENGVTRLKKYSELSTTEAIQADCDYPSTNNQLRTSLNPRQQATINNERVTIQPIQWRQNSMTAEVHNQDNVYNNVLYQDVQETSTSKQSTILNQSDTEITSDSNIISYSQYMNESQYTTVQNSSSHVLQDDLILYVIEQLKTQVVNCTKINQDNKNVNEILTAELERYKNQFRILKEQNNVDKASVSYEQSLEIEKFKHTLFEHLKEKESLEQK